MNFGFLNINKPKGISSFDVIRKLRRISGIRKMGHTGTLDPLAEGVLIMAVGQATKLIEFMMGNNKSYEAELIFGKKSNTYDAEGEIEEVSTQKPTIDEIEEAIQTFIGDIDQVPPVFSAIKLEGRRAYDLARKGEEVEMKSRKVHISKITVVSYEYPSLKIEVDCGSGTYIRSICHDLGEKLDVGAYMNALTRTQVGEFSLNNAYSLEEVEKKGVDECFIAVEDAFKDLEKMVLTSEEYKKLRNGQAVKSNVSDSIAISAAFFDNKLVGILKKVSGGENNLVKFRKILHYD
ncbi:tRNA pseudouridine(55) synthase TruB [Patescibacteria group bacterium]